ncbi:DinB family protein [Xylanibacillus composti]|uniref:DinB family protein n=1 Tax=Xylanibacillus composti TaxID=1572762 RepID=A0A8J4GZA5_9BACL|nr:DinB family protein [Xylanibacillus composti]GIQ67919.1 DinB family protein [Xylanibacillus composti]
MKGRFWFPALGYWGTDTEQYCCEKQAGVIGVQVTKQELIQQYEQYIPWLEGLSSLDEQAFRTPVGPGKWTCAEIIGHLLYWDRVLLHDIFPNVSEGAAIECPEFSDFEMVNGIAAQYAREEASIQTLIAESIEIRSQIISYLQNKSEEEFQRTFLINTSEQTLLLLMEDFTGHDRHHRQQIEKHLEKLLSA